MHEVLLDTGVWFGYFDKNDLFHHDAIDSELHSMSPDVEIRYTEIKFGDEILPSNFPKLFLKSMDFMVASCALYWEVEEFYSFDEKLNRAVRRIKPEIVMLKIKNSRVTRC